MTFEFQIGTKVFFVAGAAIAGTDFPPEFNSFAGGFRVTTGTALRKHAATIVPPVPPESGDTGIGNGTQT
jgi:hypothetical protein